MLVGAVGIELVGQSLSLAESTALTPLQPSKTPLGRRILAKSWPRKFLTGRASSSDLADCLNVPGDAVDVNGRTQLPQEPVRLGGGART